MGNLCPCYSDEGEPKIYPATEDKFDAQGVRRNSINNLVSMGLIPHSEADSLISEGESGI